MLAQLLKTLLLPPLPVMPFALALAFRSAAKPAPALRARERTAAAARMVFFTTFAFHVAIKQLPGRTGQATRLPPYSVWRR